MKVSIIGTGRMGSGLVKTIDPYVDELIWASRDKERIESIIHANKLSRIVPVGKLRLGMGTTPMYQIGYLV
ncbi:hypothetical protein [Neobacillus niacini]|uniref:hypothetical protein n=1 Tax=Neobacillus niacini TaxID=86668 RepID=UPI0021CB95D7|nr:hypothetical protein [Neobacillus niacini]MCM3766323.1 hypothetical protein [Neobacillus niacini]